jgi:hypothetical protein
VPEELCTRECRRQAQREAKGRLQHERDEAAKTEDTATIGPTWTSIRSIS